jgi:hypothetical protein
MCRHLPDRPLKVRDELFYAGPCQLMAHD